MLDNEQLKNIRHKKNEHINRIMKVTQKNLLYKCQCIGSYRKQRYNELRTSKEAKYNLVVNLY